MSDATDVRKSLLIWLDDSQNDSDDNVAVKEYFRVLGDKFQRFKSRTAYDEYIRKQPADVHISLITNGKLGQQIVPEVHSSTQIVNIYVYCFDKATHEKWAKTFEKVRGVFTDFNELRKLLPQNLTPRRSIIKSVEPEEMITDLPQTTDEPQTTDVPQGTVTGIPATYGLDGTFIIANTCFDYLVRMKTCSNDKDEFVSFCRDALQGDDNLLLLIQEFQNSYSSDQAIFWLCKHPFFQGFIENMFICACVDAMLPCRVLVRDIQKQLVQHKCTSTIHVYRSEIRSDEEIQKLKNFNGKTIAMKSFLLTNPDRATAVSYTADFSLSNGQKRIMFIIEADPLIENAKAFAQIGTIINDSSTNDVLFMIGSLFKVIEIEDEKDGFINIKLTLCGKDDTNQSIELCNQLHVNYIDQNGETDTIGFGQFLFELGNSFNEKNLCDSGEKIIRSSVEKLPENDPDRLRCYDALGSIESSKKQYDSSLEWHKKSLDLRKAKFPENLAESYTNLASFYLAKGDDEQAFEYFRQLSIVLKQSSDDECFGLTLCYSNMAIIYQKQDKLNEALSYFYRTLSIMTKHNYSNDASYAVLYNNLGNVCTALAKYQLALGFYNASLEIKLKLYSTSNPATVAATYRSIAFVHHSMNNVQQERTYLEKALAIYRQLDSSNESSIMEIEELIQNLPTVEQS